MVKIRYLVGKGNDRKFKRNVPQRLLEVAGKTAWVERVQSTNARYIREQDNHFAVYTDNEIRRLDEQISGDDLPASENPGLPIITYQVATDLAEEYHATKDARYIEDDVYFVSDDDADRDDVISDAGLEALEAWREVTGDYRTSEYRVLIFTEN